MWVRFTEVIRYGEKDIHLYFVQESNDPSNTSFTIYVKDEESFTFKMTKDQGNKWTLHPQNIPHWVFDVQPQLNNALENSVKSAAVMTISGARTTQSFG